jgi:hypothetical protein
MAEAFRIVRGGDGVDRVVSPPCGGETYATKLMGVMRDRSRYAVSTQRWMDQLRERLDSGLDISVPDMETLDGLFASVTDVER